MNWFSECAGDLAIALDASGSIGPETAGRMSANLASALFNQLARLPSTTGQNHSSANVYLISFNGDVDMTVISRHGQSFEGVRKTLTSALNEATKATGATALTYAIEQGGKILINNGKHISNNIHNC